MSTGKVATSGQSLFSQLNQIQVIGSAGKQIKKRDLLALLRSLATLTNNGVSIPQALETLLSDSSYRKYRPVIRHLLETVNAGGSLSSALEDFPSSFPRLMVHQIKVAEKSGTIQSTLMRVVRQLENASNIRSFIVKRTTYPMILLVAGACSVAFMLTNVIPAFQQMYEASDATLPAITECVIWISKMAQEYGLIVLGLLSILAIGLFAAMRNEETRIGLDRMLLRVPALGKWLRNIAILQFTETLSNLLESGFHLVEALPEAAKSVNNRYLRKRVSGLNRAVRQGERLSVALRREQDLFPPVVKQLVVVGERTGRLNEITAEIHEHLNKEVEQKTTAMLAAVEPILTTCLAVIIGGILLSVYLPMFDMIGATHK